MIARAQLDRLLLALDDAVTELETSAHARGDASCARTMPGADWGQQYADAVERHQEARRSYGLARQALYAAL